MVLSLPFILAFIGSAVALIVGMVIYGDISEAIECPTDGTGGGGSFTTLIDTFEFTTSNNNLDLDSEDRILGQLMSFNGENIARLTFQADSDELLSTDPGTLKAIIYSGVEDGSPDFTVLANSVETYQSPWDDNGDGGTIAETNNYNLVFTFSPPVVVDGSDILVGLYSTIQPDQNGIVLDYSEINISAIPEYFDNLINVGNPNSRATYDESGITTVFHSIDGIINEAVYQEGTETEDNGEIYLGINTGDTYARLHDRGVGGNQESINFWVKGDFEGTSDHLILSNMNLVELVDYCCSVDDNGLGFMLYTSNDTTILRINEQSGGTGTPVQNRITDDFDSLPNYSIPPNDSNWHMMTLTYDKSITAGNDNARLCIDGSTNCQTIPTGTTWSLSASGDPAIYDLTIGSDSDHDTGGTIVENSFAVDDVTFWDQYILTDSDIDTLYNNGVGVSASNIESGFQFGHWNFDTSSFHPTQTEEGFCIQRELGNSPDFTTTEMCSGGEDITLKIESFSEGGIGNGIGSEQCQQAKDISWTVIGIIPVALFFSLFAIFSALGTGRQ